MRMKKFLTLDGRQDIEGVLYVLYLSMCTRPDISYAVSCLAKFSSKANASHEEHLDCLLRYILGTRNVGLTFVSSKSLQKFDVIGFSDSDHCSELERM